MEHDQIVEILSTLANGVDPATGEVFPQESPYNQPNVIRALFYAVNQLPKPKKPKRTVEQKQQENLDKGLPKNYGLPWAETDVQQVIEKYQADVAIQDIASDMARKSSSIVSLLKKHEIISEQQAISMGIRF